MKWFYALQYYAYFVELADLITLYIVIETLIRVRKNKFLPKENKKSFYLAGGLLLAITAIDEVWTLCLGIQDEALLQRITVWLLSSIYALVPWVGVVFLFQKGKRSKKVSLLLIPVVLYDILCVFNGIFQLFDYFDQGYLVRKWPYLFTVLIDFYVLILLGSFGVNKKYRLSKDDRRRFLFGLGIVFLGSLGDVIYQQYSFLWLSMAICLNFTFHTIVNIAMETDMVTGVWNRNMFEMHLMDEREAKDLLLVSFDLNDLKKVNDNLGHSAGDLYLIRAAQKIQELLPEEGGLYRTGGDEFSYLYNFKNQELGQVANAIQEGLKSLEGADFAIPGAEDYHLSVAYGMRFRNDDESLKALVDKADEDMYQKKKEMKMALAQ